jgi:WD40 repeat protein
MLSRQVSALLGLLLLAWPASAQDKRKPAVPAEREIRLEHGGAVHAFAFSPDGKRLAVVGDGINKSGEVVLWDLAARKSVASFRGHAAPVKRVAFAPDGKILAASDENGVLVTWPVAGAKLLSKRSAGHLVGFTHQKNVLVRDLQAFYLWDLEEKKPKQSWNIEHDRGEGQPRLSPNGKRLAASVSSHVFVCDADTLAEPVSFRTEGHNPVESLAFSPDNRLLAVGTQGDLHLWDFSSGEWRGMLAWG